MEASTKNKWAYALGLFLSVFGSFAILMYLGIHTASTGQGASSSFYRFQQNDTRSDSSQGVVWRNRDNKPATLASGWSKKVLYRNSEKRVGNTILTYRGLEGRSKFRLDAILPDLDAQYTYSHRINIKNSQKEFQVGGERFVLISAGKHKIRLLHYTPPFELDLN